MTNLPQPPMEPSPDKSSQPDAGKSDMLELYLDDMLAPAERAAFEAMVAATPELRRLLEHQMRIDERLRAMFGVDLAETPAPDVHPAPRLTIARPARRTARWRRAGAIAAAVVLVGMAAAYLLGAFAAGDGSVSLHALYAREVRGGFVPKEVCTDSVAFRGWIARRYGQGLDVQSLPPGLKLVGWDYARVVSPYSGVLLAMVDGKQVVVVLDRLAVETAPLPTKVGRGLSTFRAVVGRLVVYEVSPFDRPRIIGHLAASDARGAGP